MNKAIDAPPPAQTGAESVAQLPSQYGCGPIGLAGDDHALYERHLIFDHIVTPTAADPRERFEGSVSFRACLA